MHLVATVFGLGITREEVLGESSKLIGQDSSVAQITALNRLIDRRLLLHQALASGLTVTEEEFDNALLETLEDLDTPPQDDMQTHQMERNIRNRILIRKYVRQVCQLKVNIGDDQLQAFYDDQREVFSAPDAVRASHILIRRDTPDAEAKARELRASIHSPEDFHNVCGEHSQCPSGVRCGDLGWFYKGQLVPEIDEVAFRLHPGEISPVFSSRHGFHILMVTEVRQPQQVRFEDIKDSLKARLVQLEKEYFLIRHVNELRKSFQDQILILDKNYHS